MASTLLPSLLSLSIPDDDGSEYTHSTYSDDIIYDLDINDDDNNNNNNDIISINDEKKVLDFILPYIEEKKKKKEEKDDNKYIPRLFDVDFVGNDSYQVTQQNLLQRRSVELVKTNDSKLSARGLYHRPKEYFQRDYQNASSNIKNHLKNSRKSGSDTGSNLFYQYFQRGVANERLNSLDRAIIDYSTCIKINPKSSASYYNRAGIYYSKGDINEALKDIDMAVKLDPGNLNYRNNRSLYLRSKGLYIEAIEETVNCRAAESSIEYMSQLQRGERLNVDSNQFASANVSEDPIIAALKIPREKRNINNMSSVIDFIQTVKFFSSINDRFQLGRIACALELVTFNKDEFVFEEGEIGNHFFIIFDGEVSIVKVKKNNKGQIISKLVLVTLFPGQSFGETALAHKDGVRSAGAYCSGKLLSLLSLYIDDYQSIMKEFQAEFTREVFHKFQSIPIFKTFNDEVMREIVKSVVVRNFSAEKVLLSKGSTNTQLFLIKQGIVKVIKHVKKPVVDDILKSNPSIPSGGLQDTNLPAGSWALDQNWKSRIKSENVTQGSYTITTVPLVVGLLCTGQVFGELSVLDPGAVSPVDIITLTNVELYVIDGAKLITLGAKYNVDCMTALNESINLSNPAAEKIDHYFRVKYKWEREKKRVISKYNFHSS